MSTSGGILRSGTHWINTWRRDRRSITLSSVEVELAAAVMARDRADSRHTHGQGLGYEVTVESACAAAASAVDGEEKQWQSRDTWREAACGYRQSKSMESWCTRSLLTTPTRVDVLTHYWKEKQGPKAAPRQILRCVHGGQWDSLTEKTTPHKSVFAMWISTQGIPVQVRKWIIFGALTTSGIRHTERQNPTTNVEWIEACAKLTSTSNDSWTLWIEPQLSLFDFVVSLPCLLVSASLDCFFSLFICTHTALVQGPTRLKFAFIPCLHAHVSAWCECCSWSLRTSSIHFFSFLIISLITLLFLPPDNFNFHDVVDKYPAYFRWGP